MPSELRIDSVETERGTYTVDGQTVTFFIPTLAPGESVQMRINTTVLGSPVDGVFINTATLTGNGETRTATAVVNVPVSLPSTGYSPSSDEPGGVSDWIIGGLVGAAALLLSVGVWQLRRRKQQFA